MLRSSFLFLSALTLFFSCNQEPIKEIMEVPALRASSIYRHDSVYVYMKRYKDEHKGIAENYYNKGIALRETNPKKATYFLKRAITLNPTLEYYKELASLLSANGMFKETSELYAFIVEEANIKENNEWISTYIYDKPDSETYYEYIMAYILNYKYLDGYILFQAKELSMNIEEFKTRLVSDKRLKIDPSSEAYKNIMLQFMTEEEIEEFKKSPSVYNDFLSSIKDTSRFFTINEKQVQNFNYNYSVEYEEDFLNVSDLYIYFLKEKQENPKKWYDYNYNHLIHINDSINAVVYAIDTSENACPKDMRHIYHMLTTFNKGKIIDQQLIAVQSGKDLMIAKFENDKVVRSEFNRYWEKPYQKNDFDNAILKTELIQEKTFLIKPDGSIEESLPGINKVEPIISNKDTAI
jgi:hypothetical protein